MFRTRFIFLVAAALLIIPAVFAENSCVDCHKKPEVISSLQKWQQEKFAEWYKSLHAVKGVTCEKCHRGNPAQAKKELAHEGVKNSSNKQSSIYYKNIPETCGACHREVYSEFRKSVMFHNLETEKLAPTCATCMGSHNVAIVDAVEVSKKCSICHNELMGVIPSIPNEARRVLLLREQVMGEASKAQSAIETAKGMGKDTTEAEKALQEARSRLAKSGSEWHAFRISAFEGEMQNALYYAYKANNLAYELVREGRAAAPPPAPKKGVCGPVAVLLIATLPLASYFLRRLSCNST